MANFEQIKINIPKNNKRIIGYCKKLAEQRILSARIIRLLSDDLDKSDKSKKDN